MRTPPLVQKVVDWTIIKLSRLKPMSWLWVLVPLTLSPLHYAHAYIDPGAGSYAIQIAIGAIFGAAYTLRSFGTKMITRFRARRNKNKQDT